MSIAAKDFAPADIPDHFDNKDYSPYRFYTAEELSLIHI